MSPLLWKRHGSGARHFFGTKREPGTEPAQGGLKTFRGQRTDRCRCRCTVSSGEGERVPGSETETETVTASVSAPVTDLDSLVPGLLGRWNAVASQHPSVARAARSRGWDIGRLRPRCSGAGGLLLGRENRTEARLPGEPGMTLCGARRGAGERRRHNVKPRTPREAPFPRDLEVTVLDAAAARSWPGRRRRD